jgi:hypothetical protein
MKRREEIKKKNKTQKIKNKKFGRENREENSRYTTDRKHKNP